MHRRTYFEAQGFAARRPSLSRSFSAVSRAQSASRLATLVVNSPQDRGRLLAGFTDRILKELYIPLGNNTGVVAQVPFVGGSSADTSGRWQNIEAARFKCCRRMLIMSTAIWGSVLGS